MNLSSQRRIRRISAIGLTAFALMAVARPAAAQSTPLANAGDSVFLRAQALVQSGNAAAGRILVDSVLAVRSPDSVSYAEALFWRASLAPNNVDAERDYQRIVVDYPLSPRSADALLQLAQLEQLRGDTALAAQHLHRFLLENPANPEWGHASYLLAELLLAQDDMRRGCLEIAHAERSVPDSLVELRNRIAFDAQRCTGVDTVAAPATPAPPARSSRTPPRAERQESNTGRFTVQVGAFPSRNGADELAAKLRKRGYDVRVAPGKLNRVWVGAYKTRSEATAAAAHMRARGIDGFVTKEPAAGPAR